MKRLIIAMVLMASVSGCAIPIEHRGDRFTGNQTAVIDLPVTDDWGGSRYVLSPRRSDILGVGSFLTLELSLTNLRKIGTFPNEPLRFIVDGNRIACFPSLPIVGADITTNEKKDKPGVCAKYDITPDDFKRLADGKKVEFQVRGVRETYEQRVPISVVKDFARFYKNEVQGKEIVTKYERGVVVAKAVAR